jgi:sulfur-oxidizing protein SoxY
LSAAVRQSYSRRVVLVQGIGCAGAIVAPSLAQADVRDETVALVSRLTGKVPTLSPRVRLAMPPKFPNGYTVPLALAVDSPMTASDYVASLRVLAPQNPVVEVATFHFAPTRSQARIATRIRLAKPQFVVALADLGDGSLLMAKTWVDVASDGCK